MAGRLNGVAAVISKEIPQAVDIHRTANCLNLAVQDSVRNTACMCDMLDYVHDTTNTVRALAKRLAAFKIIQQDLNEYSVSLKSLCPTRWTVRGRAISAVIANYSSLLIGLD